MQQTYTARIDLDEETLEVFDAMGELFGRIKHKLYARMAAAPAQTMQEWKEQQAAKKLADDEQRAIEGKAPRKVAFRQTKIEVELFSSVDMPSLVPLKNNLLVKQVDLPKKEMLRKPKAEDYKAEFLKNKAYGITARQFNALASEVDALVKSVTELLKAEQKELLLREAKLKKQAKVQEAMLMKWLEARVLNHAGELDNRQADKLLYCMGRTAQSFAKVEKRLPEVQAQLAANVPAICFGTHKLFRQQFHLEQAGYLKPLTAEQKQGRSPAEIKALESAAEEAAFLCWVADWKAARTGQFFFLGSKDETAGNQTCQIERLSDTEVATHIQLKKAAILQQKAAEDTIQARLRAADRQQAIPHYRVKIRLPTPLQKDGEKYHKATFALSYGHGHVDRAIALNDPKGLGKAISYRFCKDAEKNRWHTHISIDIEPGEKISRSVRCGAIGIDFNADHLAVAETDASGNRVKCWRVELDFKGKTADQRKDLLSVALQGIVDLAVAKKLSLVIEDLDFSEKKKHMAEQATSTGYRVMLSGLAYAQYQELCVSKCFKAGVELVKVNPAFTSVIGRVKYAKRLGISTHLAAALAIARRGQQFMERAPASAFVVDGTKSPLVCLPVRTRHSSWVTKWGEFFGLLKVLSECGWRERKRSRSRGVSLAQCPANLPDDVALHGAAI